jgi:N-carbamoylputrescine amidase
VFDAGRYLGLYRKSHIPDGPGYTEKFYFNPGDTGFKVFQTQYAAIGTSSRPLQSWCVGCSERMIIVAGVAICWDQWFPEAARAMALLVSVFLCLFCAAWLTT